MAMRQAMRAFEMAVLVFFGVVAFFVAAVGPLFAALEWGTFGWSGLGWGLLAIAWMIGFTAASIAYGEHRWPGCTAVLSPPRAMPPPPDPPGLTPHRRRG